MQRSQTVLSNAKMLSHYAVHLLVIRADSMPQAQQCQLAVSGNGQKARYSLCHQDFAYVQDSAKRFRILLLLRCKACKQVKADGELVP